MNIFYFNNVAREDAESSHYKNVDDVLHKLTQPVLNYEDCISSTNLDLNTLDAYSLIVMLHHDFIIPQLFDSDQLEKLKTYVEKGGALLISLSQTAHTATRALLEIFGISYFVDKILRQNPAFPWMLSSQLILSNSNKDLPFNDVLIHDSGYLISKDKPFLLEYNGKGIAYLEKFGSGKIGIIADTKIIAPGHIGAKDNYVLFLYMMSQLLKLSLNTEHIKQSEALLLQPLSSEMISTLPFDESIIDCSEHREFLKTLSEKILSHPYVEREKFIFEASLLFDEFPKVLREKIKKFKNAPNKNGFIALRGLPPDENLIKTPIKPEEPPLKQTFRSEFFLAAFGSSLGDVFTFIQEKGGAMYQNIFPTPLNTYNISSESSKIYLDFHTEIAFHPVTTDYLLLYCLRSDHEKTAGTLVFSIQNLLPCMPRRYYDVLFEEVFQTGIDYSFGSPNGEKANGPIVSILSGERTNPYFRCDFDLMVGLTPLAQEAFDYLREHSLKVSHTINLSAGDLLIIDNNRAMHGRTPFSARYDGYDRWLQRTLVSRDLSSHKRSLPIHDRTITLQFAV